MARTVGIGIQDFEKIRNNNLFYIDKTDFIREWWESGDEVTLITRPRRFGKTLNMSMLNCFFSNQYKDQGEKLFSGLSIWDSEEFRELQGQYPVIFLSFAKIKETTYENARTKLISEIVDAYDRNAFLLNSDLLSENEKLFVKNVNMSMDDAYATLAIGNLSKYLEAVYGKKAIILLDEYDTPMQEAWLNGYWDELVSFTRSLFNATFKTNPHLERAVITGVTRISKESIFSDLNNLAVVTTTSDQYATSFGFTEEEVFAAMEEQGIGNDDNYQKVKLWYDGFTFGSRKDIYNPWSIINYLKNSDFRPYWSNSSGNGLIGGFLRQADSDIKTDFEALMHGQSLHRVIDEQVIFNQLDTDSEAIWSLMVASGYLKLENAVIYGDTECDLSITNQETLYMFRNLIKGWFRPAQKSYNNFITALLTDDVKRMNAFMNKVALQTFSFFDSGSRPSAYTEPERFYHGFVLGLLVELREHYELKSNRESGFGRYDVMLKPFDPLRNPAVIMEFKVMDEIDDEKSLEDTAASALRQIEEKKYEEEFLAASIPLDRIRKYGFAFEGKKVLIVKG